ERLEEMTAAEGLAFLESQKGGLRPEQKRFLEQALAYYQQYTSQEALSEEERARQARASFRMAYLQERLGLHAEAETAYRAARKEFERLGAGHPARPQDRQGLATTPHHRGPLRRGP